MAVQLSPHPPESVRSHLVESVPNIGLATWQALSGGRTNSTWLVRHPARDLVVKLYSGAQQNPLFPNLPKAEIALLQHLERFDLAPSLVAAFETGDGACLVYEHIPGEIWHSGSEDVARLMRRLHKIAPPGGLRQCLGGSRALVQQTNSILNQCQTASDLPHLRPEVELPSCENPVLLHGDIVAANLISTAHGLRLIDWQCPALGDPCEDIAIFLSPAMQQVYRGAPLSGAETRAFLTAYDRPEITERYRKLAPLFHWRMAAYCSWQVERGRSEYARARQLELKELDRARAETL